MKEISPMEAIFELTRITHPQLSSDVIRLVNAISIAILEDDDDLKAHVNGMMDKINTKINWSMK